MTVKDIAQMLQSFGTELAETKLPDEGKAIECLLESHTEKYRKLKVWLFSWKLHLLFYTMKYIYSTAVNVHFLCQDAITSVSKEGRHLLLSLEISGKEDESQWDVRMDWETVQR